MAKTILFEHDGLTYKIRNEVGGGWWCSRQEHGKIYCYLQCGEGWDESCVSGWFDSFEDLLLRLAQQLKDEQVAEEVAQRERQIKQEEIRRLRDQRQRLEANYQGIRRAMDSIEKQLIELGDRWAVPSSENEVPF